MAPSSCGGTSSGETGVSRTSPSTSRSRLGRVVVGDPAHEAPHQGLGNAPVHVVHGDVVAGEGGEPEGELGEIAGAHDDPALLVGEVHEHLGALPGLEVLEGDARTVVGVQADVADVLLAGRPDVDLPQLGPGRLRESVGVSPGALRGAKGRHRHREDPLAVRGPAGRRSGRTPGAPVWSRGLRRRRAPPAATRRARADEPVPRSGSRRPRGSGRPGWRGPRERRGEDRRAGPAGGAKGRRWARGARPDSRQGPRGPRRRRTSAGPSRRAAARCRRRSPPGRRPVGTAHPRPAGPRSPPP